MKLLLDWKDVSKPSEESRNRYLGEWISEGDGPDEPFGRGYILYDDGSLYLGTVKFDRTTKDVARDGYGRYIPAEA